jgi:hypothetical protein
VRTVAQSFLATQIPICHSGAGQQREQLPLTAAVSHFPFQRRGAAVKKDFPDTFRRPAFLEHVPFPVGFFPNRALRRAGNGSELTTSDRQEARRTLPKSVPVTTPPRGEGTCDLAMGHKVIFLQAALLCMDHPHP